jgi:hypothetical protein
LLAGFSDFDQRLRRLNGGSRAAILDFAFFHRYHCRQMTGLRGRMRFSAPGLAAAFCAAALAAIPAHGLATSALAALDQLERGRWQVRDLDANVDRQSLCVGDPVILAQIEHQGPPCAREVIESGPDGGTIRYTCRGRGFGHSMLRVQTPRLVRIHTQGINGAQPFNYRAEARRIGDC